MSKGCTLKDTDTSCKQKFVFTRILYKVFGTQMTGPENFCVI